MLSSHALGSSVVGVLTALLVAVPSAAATPTPAPFDATQAEPGPRGNTALAPAAMPLFQLPFTCGRRTYLSTYPGHDPYDIDMRASEGTPLLAAAGGVARRGHSDKGGFQVTIDHDGGQYRTLYLHLKPDSYRFSEGARITQGQQIAETGNSGRGSSGPHLHYQLMEKQGQSWVTVRAWFNGQLSGIDKDTHEYGYFDTSNNCPGGQPGGWTTYGLIAAGIGSGRLEMADVNGDSRSDYLRIATNGAIDAWIFNGGDGVPNGWIEKRNLAAGVGTGRLEVTDINGDGRADYLRIGNNGSITAWLNNFDRNLNGTWQPAVTWAAGIGTGRLELADLDGNGYTDYLRIGDNGSITAWWNHGGNPAGPGGWRGPTIAAHGTGTGRLEFADVNGDDKDDYLRINEPGGAITAWTSKGLNPQGQLEWANARVIARGTGGTGRIELTDLNGDHMDDYLRINEPGGAITAWLNNGGDA